MSHTCSTSWSTYIGNIDVSYCPFLNSSKTVESETGSSTRTGGDFGAATGDTCLREKQSRRHLNPRSWCICIKWTGIVGGCKSLTLFLRTNACSDILSSLNRSWLSAMLLIIKPNKPDKGIKEKYHKNHLIWCVWLEEYYVIKAVSDVSNESILIWSYHK